MDEDVASGRVRPAGMPENWVGRPTTSSPGWRWDDPNNPGNSVRIFQGIPNAPEPWHREPFVIDVRNGRVRDVNGNDVADQAAAQQELLEHY